MHKKLFAERKAQGITQAEMAEVLGLNSYQSYSSRENGHMDFTLLEAIKISEHLDVPINILFDDLFQLDSDKNAQ